MSKHLTLSVIIPAYNEERHLAACLDSLAAQTVQPFEVIVVDNNSTDNTTKIARSYPFVRVVKEKKQGIVYARDAGFNAAHGDIIGRIDSDSILPPNWVEFIDRFYAKPANRGAALTGGGMFYNTPMPRVSRWVLDLLAFRVNRVVLGHHFLFGSNMALPRSVWQKVRPSVCVRDDIHEDIDIAIHLHELDVPIVYKSSFLVGIKLRRVFQNHKKLWSYLMLWPQTYRVHGNILWVTGLIGAVLLYALTPLVYPLKGIQLLHYRLSSGAKKAVDLLGVNIKSFRG